MFVVLGQKFIQGNTTSLGVHSEEPSNQTNQAEPPAATQMGRKGRGERGRRNPGIRGPTRSHRETLPGPPAGRGGPSRAATTLALLPAPGHRTEAAVPFRRSRTTSLAPKPHPGPPRPPAPAPPSRLGCQPPPAQVAQRARAAYTLGDKEGPRARKGHPNPAPSPGSPRPRKERKEDKGQGTHLAKAARRQQRPSCTPYGSLGVPRGHRRISSPE